MSYLTDLGRRMDEAEHEMKQKRAKRARTVATEHGYVFKNDGAVYKKLGRTLEHIGYVSDPHDPDARLLAAEAADEELAALMAEAKEEFGS